MHVLLPKRDAEAIKDALASHAAAQETVQAKPTPQTDEGKEAQRAMKGRIDAEEERLDDPLPGGRRKRARLPGWRQLRSRHRP